MNDSKLPDLAGVLSEIGKVRFEPVASTGLDARLALVRQWQSDRLARTHSDLVASARYGPAMRFFLEDVYAARDFTQRNHDIERLYNLLRSFVPEPMIRPLVLTVRLHYLTERLDERLLEVMTGQLHMEREITAELYAEAYRRCDNRADRVEQIELVYEVGTALDAAVNLPLSGAMLGMAGNLLRRGGWVDLLAFMQRGYRAFRQLHGAKPLLQTIRAREMAILARIYENDPQPFEFGGRDGRRTN